MRIRTRLLLLSLAVLVPALVGAAVGIGYVYQEQRALHRQNLRETARALALVLDRELGERETILNVLAASPALAAGDLRAFYDHARALVDNSHTTIILSDLDGRQLLNTRLPLDAPRPRMLPMEREFRARYGPEPTLVSNLYLPPAGLGPASFAIQVPVRQAGEVRQFLSMATFAGQLQRLFSDQGLPAEWQASIIDREGVVVARSRDPERFVGSRVRPELLAQLRESPEGLHPGATLEGTPAVAVFSRSPRAEWVFVVSVPDSVLDRAGLRAGAYLGAITLLLLGLAVAVAFAVGRGIAGPMESLRRAAERLGRNEPVEHRACGVVEVDEVRHAMVEASSRLRRTNAELEHQVAEAVASYETSQRALVQAQKLEALGRLTGGIAHDFNNVLQTLTTGLQAARLDAPEKVRRLLATCERAVARGSELARQLMVFGRVQEVRVEAFELGRRLFDAQAMLAGALPTSIDFSLEAPRPLGTVKADPLQLELALLNLVLNARDAMPAGGRLQLRAWAEHGIAPAPDLAERDWLVIALRDTGEGMSQEVLARAFDPFFTTKGVGRGSGMGLAQAYGFARQSGGTLVLESRVGEGTTATLYLPLSAEAPREPAAAEALPAGVHGHGRVLLVEDDPLVRETVRTGLEASGFELHAAGSADEALRLLATGEPIEVVFTDVVMPGALSGVDLARRIARDFPRVRVVIATGYSDRSVNLPGVKALAKPYDLRQAVAALNEALGR
jgi:signal transduction histidine kinase